MCVSNREEDSVHHTFDMPQFFTTLLENLRGKRGTDMRLLCKQLLSQRGEASQTVLAKRIIELYKASEPEQRIGFPAGNPVVSLDDGRYFSNSLGIACLLNPRRSRLSSNQIAGIR